MPRCSPQQANDEVWSFLQKIYQPNDSHCPVHVAVRKVLHWERTDVMSTQEFRELVIARTVRNITVGVHNKMSKDRISFADWRAQIKNLEAWLTRCARRAAIDEARKVLHLRDTKKQRVYLMPSSLMEESHDPTTAVLAFLRAKSSLHEQHDIVEHFRLCGPCLTRLQAIKFLLREFNYSGRMQPTLIGLVKLVGIKDEAIKINLITRNLLDLDLTHRQSSVNHAESEQKEKDMIELLLKHRRIVDRNLDLLGCSQSQREDRDILTHRMIHQNQLIDMGNRITAVLFLATGRLKQLRAWADGERTLKYFWKDVYKERFDQILTNGSKPRSTKPTKSTFQRNPPCAPDLD